MEDSKWEELSLTEEQIRAAKQVYKAMRNAHKLGVFFWDNYGTLQCFNGNKISCPSPDLGGKDKYSLRDYDVSYYELLPQYAFQAGNADDELFYSEK